VQSLPTSPLSLFSLSLSLSRYRLALFTRSAKAHTKLPRPSSHASAAPHTLKSRSQFYVPKIPTNWVELSALLTPRTIPELQVPIRCPENSNQVGRSCLPFWHPGQYQNFRSQFDVPKIPTNWGDLPAISTPRTITELQVPIQGPEIFNQLGRVARHFDTPDNNTWTPGPNSMFRKFEPIGESCPRFWHPGHYKNSRSQFDVPKIPTNWVELPAMLEPRTIPELQVPMPSLNERFLLGQILIFFSQNN
jgi:hypothetical protein